MLVKVWFGPCLSSIITEIFFWILWHSNFNVQLYLLWFVCFVRGTWKIDWHVAALCLHYKALINRSCFPQLHIQAHACAYNDVLSNLGLKQLIYYCHTLNTSNICLFLVEFCCRNGLRERRRSRSWVLQARWLDYWGEYWAFKCVSLVGFITTMFNSGVALSLDSWIWISFYLSWLLSSLSFSLINTSFFL